MRKIEILNQNEQQLFDDLPEYTVSEQKINFVLPDEVSTWATTITIPSYLVGFILLWGYAKSKCKFFSPNRFKISDIQYVYKSMGIDQSTISFITYSQRTYSYHKQIVRKYLQIKPFDKSALDFSTEAVQDKVSRHQSPKQILYEVVQLCAKQPIEVPGYNRFTTIISEELGKFEINLASIIRSSITLEQKHVLKELIKPDSSCNYPLTKFKTINQERNPASIRDSVKDFLTIKNTLQIVLPLIKQLNLHAETIKFFAT
ncbi:MAG: DUF4158 domain-containing protein [Neisseriaceae bacterium]